MLENWQLGREVKVITKEEEDVLESKEDKVFTVLKKRKVFYFESDSVHEEKKSTKDESSEKPTVDVTSTIIMPPKMVKRGRPKGVKLTVIGLPSRKKTKFGNKTQKVVFSFSKLRPNEKDRSVLECFAKSSALWQRYINSKR